MVELQRPDHEDLRWLREIVEVAILRFEPRFVSVSVSVQPNTSCTRTASTGWSPE